MAAQGGHHATRGAWLSVFVICAAFGVGLAALIRGSMLIGIVAIVVLAVGGVAGLTSKIMEQAH